ncbi:MAG: N-acetylmuramoyl-L-alanine amidase, partial [Qipengyuania sp.]
MVSLAPWVSHGNHIASSDNKAVTMHAMSIRTHILLLVLLPLAVVAALVVTAQRIPVPEIGRAYVLRVNLPKADAPGALP